MARPTKWTSTILNGKNERATLDQIIDALFKHYNIMSSNIESDDSYYRLPSVNPTNSPLFNVIDEFCTFGNDATGEENEKQELELRIKKYRKLIFCLAKDLEIPAFLQSRFLNNMNSFLDILAEFVFWVDITFYAYEKQVSVKKSIENYFVNGAPRENCKVYEIYKNKNVDTLQREFTDIQSKNSEVIRLKVILDRIKIKTSEDAESKELCNLKKSEMIDYACSQILTKLYPDDLHYKQFLAAFGGFQQFNR